MLQLSIFFNSIEKLPEVAINVTSKGGLTCDPFKNYSWKL